MQFTLDLLALYGVLFAIVVMLDVFFTFKTFQYNMTHIPQNVEDDVGFYRFLVSGYIGGLFAIRVLFYLATYGLIFN